MTEEQRQPSMSEVLGLGMQSNSGGEEEILRIASDYALQIRPDQLRTLIMLKVIAMQYKDKNTRFALEVETFISTYLQMKHFHESGYYIMGIIERLAYKKLIPNDAVKVNVMK